MSQWAASRKRAQRYTVTKTKQEVANMKTLVVLFLVMATQPTRKEWKDWTAAMTAKEQTSFTIQVPAGTTQLIVTVTAGGGYGAVLSPVDPTTTIGRGGDGEPNSSTRKAPSR